MLHISCHCACAYILSGAYVENLGTFKLLLSDSEDVLTRLVGVGLAYIRTVVVVSFNLGQPN